MPIVLSSEPGRAHLGGSIFCWDRVQRYATSIFDWIGESPYWPFGQVIRLINVQVTGPGLASISVIGSTLSDAELG